MTIFSVHLVMHSILFKVFIKPKFNVNDSIIGFGAAALIGFPNSLLKGELISSLNYADMLDKRCVIHDFLSSDTGLRPSVYGKAFVYIEADFGTLELFLDDVQDDVSFYDPPENNVIDGYAGIGAGFNADDFQIEGVVKARQIDGDYWDSD